MALLRQEITNRGIEGGIGPIDPDVVIQELDPQALLEIQAVFGTLLQESPRLTAFANNLGPVLFATCLFTCFENYQIDPEDEDNVIATNDVFTAEAEAIGMIRSVAAAMGKLYGEVSIEPTESEVEEDTDIVAIE